MSSALNIQSVLESLNVRIHRLPIQHKYTVTIYDSNYYYCLIVYLTVYDVNIMYASKRGQMANVTSCATAHSVNM